MREYREFKLKTIMVATDFVGTSYGPINYAKQLARHFSAKILLVHVVPMMETAKGNLPQLIDAAEEELQKYIDALSFDGIRSAMIVRVGNVRQTVLDLIAERDADLLVVGTRGEELGSVAETLLRAVPCPVLTVGKHARSNCYESTHTRTLLFATDFSEVSRAALAYTESLVKHFDGSLLLLHADESQPSDHKDEFQALTKELTNPSIVSESITRLGRPAEVVISVSKEKHVDFIVMGVHGKDQAGKRHSYGTAFEVIRRARCPVFTLLAQFEKEKEVTEAEEFRLQQRRLARSADQLVSSGVTGR